MLRVHAVAKALACTPEFRYFATVTPSEISDPIGADSARALVSQLTAALQGPIAIAEAQSDRAPLRFAEVVEAGAFFCKLIASIDSETGGRLTEHDQQLLQDVLANVSRPEALEALLLSRIEAGDEAAEELARLPELIKRFMEQPYNIRRFLQKIIRQMIPPNAPGRKRQIYDADRPKLLARAEQLRPALMAMAQVLQASRKCSIAEALQFLRKEYPEACNYLLTHIKELQSLRADDRLMTRAKTVQAKMRIMADAMAGVERDISASYSVQVVQEARRASRRHAKRPILQKL